MKTNIIKIVINSPLAKVFEFSTNPKNTGLWFNGILEERADEYPPKIGTIYENLGAAGTWNKYSVSAFEQNKLFELTNGNFSVRYDYEVLDNGAMCLTYTEFVNTGELSELTSYASFVKLKEIMENKE
jgi:hypothetical protein